MARRAPGAIRDAITRAFANNKGKAMTVAEIREAVSADLGEDVAQSSVRSYLNLNTPGRFIRTDRGVYRSVRK